MPEESRIKYGVKAKKIKRKFSPEWLKNSGKADIEELLPRYVNSLLTQRKAMVEYIEELHDEIDRLQECVKNYIYKS